MTQTDWVSTINAMDRHEKFIVLGVIASKFAFNYGESLNWHYQFAPPLVHVGDFVPVRIDANIVALEELEEANLLELCEALVAQLRTQEVRHEH
ncbi:hypothetical protein NDI39_29330 [Microcoleus sp. ZQ-A2]|nr:hypothetical protein [Microcoleus sp. FACHB-1]